jgi:hypothetical protein
LIEDSGFDLRDYKGNRPIICLHVGGEEECGDTAIGGFIVMSTAPIRNRTKTDPEWSEALETALTATRRDDLKHGTNAAYVQGCVCSDCREH